jgi:DNA-binding transcriptional ArsR family regulator
MAATATLDDAVARVAAAIGEPARARMLFGLMDRHARTSTELAVVGGVSPSTASAHLHRLRAERLVRVVAQGRHRYYQLEGAEVADVLERLGVLAGAPRRRFVPPTPERLRAARSCYDHLAGTLAVALHDRLLALGWLAAGAGPGESYTLTPAGARELSALGVDVPAALGRRRQVAFGCLDWSERRFHVGGAVGAALLAFLVARRWVREDLDSRALEVTALGRREFGRRFGLAA